MIKYVHQLTRESAPSQLLKRRMSRIDNDISTLIYQVIYSFAALEVPESEYLALIPFGSPFPFLSCPKGVCHASKVLVQKATRTTPELYRFFINPLVSYIHVVKRHFNVDDGEVTLQIEYDNGLSIQKKEVPRSILSKNDARQLMTLGVKFLERDSDLLFRFLLADEAKAPTEKTHAVLGWCSLEGTLAFKHSSIFLPEDILQSEYTGTLNIEPYGTSEAWLNMVRTEVIGNIPITFAMVLGFASPLLSYIGKQSDLGSLLFCLSNDSSRGKSTAAMLACSVFSDPAINHGTFRSFNATQNFLTTFLSNASGLTVAFDEAAAYTGEFSQLLYLLSGGSDKNRLNSDSSMKPQQLWQNVILTTGEFPLLSDDTAPNGLRARCFEITDVLTISAENSDRIKACILNNYGVCGTEFLKWFFEKKLGKVNLDYADAKEKLLQNSLNAAQASPLTNRICSKLAVVLLTAFYFSECFGIDPNIPALTDYIVKLQENATRHTDIAENFLDLLMQEVSRNSSHYITADHPFGTNVVGSILEEKEGKTISILKDELRLICRRHKILNFVQLLKTLKQRGILQAESDRLEKRVRLSPDTTRQTCYVFFVNDPIAHRDFVNSSMMTTIQQLRANILPIDTDTIDF